MDSSSVCLSEPDGLGRIRLSNGRRGGVMMVYIAVVIQQGFNEYQQN